MRTGSPGVAVAGCREAQYAGAVRVMGQPGFLRPLKCFKMWWPGTELNRRRQPFQGCALPTELPGRGNSSVATRRQFRNAQSCLTAIPHRRSKAVGKPHNRGCFLGLAPIRRNCGDSWRVVRGHLGPPRRAPGSAEAPRYASAGCRSGVSLPATGRRRRWTAPVPWCRRWWRNAPTSASRSVRPSRIPAHGDSPDAPRTWPPPLSESRP